jgi:hypothetical protein
MCYLKKLARVPLAIAAYKWGTPRGAVLGRCEEECCLGSFDPLQQSGSTEILEGKLIEERKACEKKKCYLDRR